MQEVIAIIIILLTIIIKVEVETVPTLSVNACMQEDKVSMDVVQEIIKECFQVLLVLKAAFLQKDGDHIDQNQIISELDIQYS